MTRLVYDSIERTTDRVRRLLAIACYDLVSGLAESKVCDTAVKFAAVAVDEPGFQELAGRHRLACSQVEPSPGWTYKVELAVELAALCVAAEVDHQKLCSVIWTVHGFLGEEATEGIHKCLGLTGESPRYLWVPSQLTSDVTSVARRVYRGDSGAIPILADAMDDAGLDSSHLREPGRHWKGCWVVDNVLGHA